MNNRTLARLVADNRVPDRTRGLARQILNERVGAEEAGNMIERTRRGVAKVPWSLRSPAWLRRIEGTLVKEAKKPS